MTWETLERYLPRQETPIRISAGNLYFSPDFIEKAKVVKNRYVVVFFDTVKKQIAFKFIPTRTGQSRKVSMPKVQHQRGAYVRIIPLLRILKIPFTYRENFECTLNKEKLYVFSYKNAPQGKTK